MSARPRDKWSVAEDGGVIRFRLQVGFGGGDGMTTLSVDEAEGLLRDLTRSIEIMRLRREEDAAVATVRADFAARIEARRGAR